MRVWEEVQRFQSGEKLELVGSGVYCKRALPSAVEHNVLKTGASFVLDG